MTQRLMSNQLSLTALVSFRKVFSAFLVGVILSVSLGWQTVSAQTAQDAAAIEKARTTVQSLGTGQKAQVKVKHKDKRTLRGYISSSTANNFTLIDSKSGATETIAYADVKDVSKKRGGLSPLGWGIIAGAAAAAVIIGVTVIRPVLCDGGAGC